MLRSAIAISFIFLLFSSLVPVHAKLLPRAGGAKPSSGARAVSSGSRGVTASVKFRGDRLGIVATFTNLSIANSVSYTLTYQSRGTTQGAGGSIQAGAAEPVVRELIFGTCSHGVCRYDSGITNARLSVTTTLKNGRKVVKTFRLKV